MKRREIEFYIVHVYRIVSLYQINKVKEVCFQDCSRWTSLHWRIEKMIFQPPSFVYSFHNLSLIVSYLNNACAFPNVYIYKHLHPDIEQYKYEPFSKSLDSFQHYHQLGNIIHSFSTSMWNWLLTKNRYEMPVLFFLIFSFLFDHLYLYELPLYWHYYDGWWLLHVFNMLFPVNSLDIIKSTIMLQRRSGEMTTLVFFLFITSMSCVSMYLLKRQRFLFIWRIWRGGSQLAIFSMSMWQKRTNYC